MSVVATSDAFAAPEAEIGFETDQETAKLFSIKGRMGVLKYAAQFVLWSLIFMAAIGAVFLAVGGSGAAKESIAIVAGIGALLALPFLYLMICLIAKRLHDLNMSAWFSLLMCVPVVGSIFGMYVMFMPGKADANRFGAQALTKGWEKVIGGLYIALTAIGVAFFVYGLATGGMSTLMPS